MMARNTLIDPRVVGLGLLSLAVWIGTTGSVVTGALWAGALLVLLLMLRAWVRERPALPRYSLVWVVTAAAMTMVLYLLFAPGGGVELYHVGPVRITGEALRAGAIMALRLLAFAFLAATAALLVPPLHLAAGLTRLLLPLRQLGVPVEQVFYFAFFLLKMFPFLVRETRIIRLAQESRGVVFSGPMIVRWRSFSALVLPVFSSAMRRSDQLALALASRGFDTRYVPAAATMLRLRRGDWVVVTALLAGWGVWLWLRLA